MIVSFFFSSRRRHTRWPRDWSSDVVLFRSDRQAAVLFDIAVGDRRMPSAGSEHGQRCLELASDEVGDRVDAGRRKRTYAIDEPFSVGNELSTQATQELVVALRRRADDTYATGPRYLHTDAADTARSGMDQESVAFLDAESVDRTTG